MTDDLVTQLRKACLQSVLSISNLARMLGIGRGKESPKGFSDLVLLLSDFGENMKAAADEIERLTRELDEAKELAYAKTDDGPKPWKECWQDEVDINEMNRRAVKDARHAIDFIARWSWHKNRPTLTDEERLSIIKHYPMIERAAIRAIAEPGETGTGTQGVNSGEKP